MIYIGKYPYKRFIAATTATIASAGIGAAAGIGNAIAQGNMNRKNREWNEKQAQIQREWNEKMWNETNAWNLEMWNKTNEYNSPEQQVARLRDAGLNPLYYGLDGSSANGLEAGQPLGYERAEAGDQPNPVSAGLNAGIQVAQMANIEADTQKKRSETQNINAKLPYEVEELKNQVRNSKLDGDAKEVVNKYLDQQQEAELRVKTSTADANDKTIEKAAAEIEKMDYEKTTMYIGWLETQERILNLQKQRDLTDAQMEELASLVRKNNAEAAKIGLDVKNYDDITVLGTASSTMKLGPITIQQGEPITLGMKKAADAHREQLEKEQEKNKGKKTRSAEGQVSATDGSVYNGPIYD